MKPIAIVCAASSLALSSGSTSVTLGATAFSSSTAVGSGSVGLADLQVDEAWVSFADVRFRPVAKCDVAGTPDIAGPVVAELVSGRTYGLADHVELGAGRYCEVEFTWHRSRARVDGVPQSLRRRSVVIRAHLADDTRVVIRSRTEAGVALRAGDDGFEIGDGDQHLLLGADLGTWLSGLDLTTADVTHRGGASEIEIDEQHNRPLLETFERALGGGIGLYRDANGDGVLDGDELTALASGAR